MLSLSYYNFHIYFNFMEATTNNNNSVKKPNKINGLESILSRYQTFLFDMDGIIWNGEVMIEPSIKVLNLLKSNNKQIFFITNTSWKGIQQIRLRLLKNGFEATREQIYTSNKMLALYITHYHPQIQKVYIVGSHFMIEEFHLVGLQTQTCSEPAQGMNLHQFKHLIANLDDSVHAVVSGHDYEMSYRKLCYASLYIQKKKPWFHSNPDAYLKVQGFKMPGAGTIMNQIKTATKKQPIVVGKPNTFIVDYIKNIYKLDLSKALMIGDNLNTDIQLGINTGMDTLCILTGVTSQEEYLADPRATYYSETL